MDKKLKEKAKKIKFLFTDCDGVLTDTGVYYSERGEELKKFSIRDGMGVELLRNMINIETGIMSGEDLELIRKRASKLKLEEVHLGIKDKKTLMTKILESKNISFEELAYIGDDINDVEVMEVAGLTACPADATHYAKNKADFVCPNKGGQGAFRDFVELIIEAKTTHKRKG